MAAAVIVIDQPTNANPNGFPGRSRDDINIGELVHLSNDNDIGVRQHFWEILDQPDLVSPDQLSNPLAPAPTFTPNSIGTYRIRLRVNLGRTGETMTRLVAVRDNQGFRYPAAGEEVEANWIDADTLAPNERGWWPDLRNLVGGISGIGIDNRGTPLTTGIAAALGGTVNFEIDVGLPAPFMVYFRIVASAPSASHDIQFFADAGFSVLLHEFLAVDLTTPFISTSQVPLFSSDGVSPINLEDNTVRGTITNNSAVASSYDIELVVKP